jgi:5-methylcytosine-specific restriction endonuclease McrA
MVQVRNLGVGERSSAYPYQWTSGNGRQLREWIRERDQRICQVCGATEGAKVHAVHHIDYEKDNINPSNLITLCHPCHGKTNHDRCFWQAFFEQFMAERSDAERAA